MEISNTKKEIMELFWNQDKTLCFSEIMDYFGKEKGKEWKKQTLSTFLQELVNKGFLEREYRGKNTFFTPLVSKEQYEFSCITDIIDEKYQGKTAELIVSLLQHYEITKEEKEKLLIVIMNI